MRLEELHYELPPERIAHHPASPRDAARMLVLDRATGRVEHRVFREIVEYLRADDCLVVNDTRVLPARFFCRRQSGGRIEALFLRPDADRWRVLLKRSQRLKAGERLRCEGADVDFELCERLERGEWAIRPDPVVPAAELLAGVGQMPLPPYISRVQGVEPADAQEYQTVYASRDGAVAAPTAGLHFTPELLERVEAIGVTRVAITLHVGAGTFTPVTVTDLARHPMHAEWFEAPQAATRAMQAARARGGRVISVGTTSARALESLAGLDSADESGWTSIFLYPPYTFHHVDALVTNFHLPGSTLLAMVMAFAGIERVREAYRTAIEQGYRFYSYGDAMLIL